MAVELCGITGGIGFDCEKANNASGGFLPTFYLFNLADLDLNQGENGLDIDANGYVSDFSFQTYKGLYVFSSPLNTVGARTNGAQNENGILAYTHEADFLLFANTPAEIAAVKSIGQGQQVGAILQRRNLQWILLGGVSGMKISVFDNDYGKLSTDNTGRVVTLSGTEPDDNKIVFFQSVAQTNLMLSQRRAS